MSQVDTLAQLSEEAFWSYARELVGMVPVADKLAPEQRAAVYAEYLECVIGEGHYLFPLAALHEVVPPPHHYTFLPGRPVWMVGLAAWRGVALAVIDLSLYLTGNPDNVNESMLSARLLIAHDGDLSLGFLVHTTDNSIAASNVPPVASDDEVVLDVPALLVDIVRQLAMATPHG